MDGLEPSAFQVVAGFVLLATLFVVCEIASGAMKEAGKELWVLISRRRAGDDLNNDALRHCGDQ
jgi:hypothetical protein